MQEYFSNPNGDTMLSGMKPGWLKQEWVVERWKCKVAKGRFRSSVDA
jgi:hypothetical protein